MGRTHLPHDFGLRQDPKIFFSIIQGKLLLTGYLMFSGIENLKTFVIYNVNNFSNKRLCNSASPSVAIQPIGLQNLRLVQLSPTK